MKNRPEHKRCDVCGANEHTVAVKLNPATLLRVQRNNPGAWPVVGYCTPCADDHERQSSKGWPLNGDILYDRRKRD